MITLKNRYLIIPKNEQKIGIVGDNQVEIRQFEIIEPSLFGLDFKLDIKDVDDNIGTIDLVKTIESKSIVLTWEVLEQHITKPGLIYIGLRAFDDVGLKWHSNINTMIVGDSFNTTSGFPMVLPSEFEQIEQRVTIAKNKTIEAKELVIQKANEVSNNAQTITEKTQSVLDKAQEVANNTNLVSQLKTTVEGLKNSVDTNKGIVDQKAQSVIDKEATVAENKDIVVQKASEVSQNAQQVADDTTIVEDSTNLVVDKANATVLNKEATDANKLITEGIKSDVLNLKNETEALHSSSLELLNMQTSLLATTPTWYMKDSIANMQLITTMKDSDFCIINPTGTTTQSLYRYFTKDINGNNLVTHAWVWISDLSLLQLSKAYLLGILQLPTVATSGSYNDLLNKPNRYESIIVLANGNWDFSLSDYAKLTMTQNTTLAITNVYNGAFGVIEVFGGYTLTLPVNSYEFPPEWNYLTPSINQHYCYSFKYDGVKFSWKRSVESNV